MDVLSLDGNKIVVEADVEFAEYIRKLGMEGMEPILCPFQHVHRRVHPPTVQLYSPVGLDLKLAKRALIDSPK